MTRILLIVTCMAAAAILFPLPAGAGWDEETQTFTPSDGQVVFYDSYQCKGKPFMVVQRGRVYNDMRSYYLGESSSSGNWNDRVSCVHVGPNTTVTVYQHIKFAGSSTTYRRTNNNPEGEWSLSGNWWDNSISSCKVP